MIDYTVFRRYVEEYLEAHSTLIIVKENTFADDNMIDFVRVIDKSIDSNQLEMGEDLQLSKRALVFKIYNPQGTGTDKARSMASEIANMVSEMNTDDIQFLPPEFDSEGIDEDTSFYVHSLIIPYFNVTG